MRGTGRSTQLPGRVRKESTTFGAFMGFENHFGGVVAVSGGTRTKTPPKWCSKPLSASKGVILTRTRPGNWVGRPVLRNSTPLLLSTRLQLRSQRRPERVPLPTATTGSRKWCWASLSASKGALSMRTYPGNWVGRAVSYNITHHFPRRRLRVRQRRRHEGATSRTARVSHPCGAGPPCVRPKAPFLCAPTQVVGWVGLRATTPRFWTHSGAPSTILVTSSWL